MGIPCGVQLTAAPGKELTALALAEVLERELDIAEHSCAACGQDYAGLLAESRRLELTRVEVDAHG